VYACRPDPITPERSIWVREITGRHPARGTGPQRAQDENLDDGAELSAFFRVEAEHPSSIVPEDGGARNLDAVIAAIARTAAVIRRVPSFNGTRTRGTLVTLPCPLREKLPPVASSASFMPTSCMIVFSSRKIVIFHCP